MENSTIEAIKSNQKTITRMANNSQNLKNYFIILTFLMLIFIGFRAIYFPQILVSYTIISVVFWYLDAKYLKLERLFIHHHKAIVNGKLTTIESWSFNPKNYKTKNILKVMIDSFSVLIYPFLIATVWIVCFLV